MEELKELLLLYRNSNTDFGIALEQRILDKYAELEAEVAYMEQLTSAKMEAEAKWAELEAENKRLKEEAKSAISWEATRQIDSLREQNSDLVNLVDRLKKENRMLRSGYKITDERFSEMKKEIEMAEHQLTGFASARNGESIEQLACSMGLAVDEWNTIKVHGIVVLPKDDEAALDEYFR
ncbi:MAG: hypothetical protein LLG05_14820 [Porphyromonadaceae bacterium]|nr:hypothetical protein [Porphyromonadaceae bacterium]